MQVLKAPDARLRVETKPVKKITPGLLQTLDEMIRLTKTFKDPEGVGLAATQVGLEEQYFVAKEEPEDEEEAETEPAKFIKVLNPKIISTAKKSKKYFEGCLSIPNYWGEVERFLSIKVEYMDELGNKKIVNLKGVQAWIFQHEIDHLNGKLFPDRVLEQGGKFYKFVGKDKTGTDNFEEVTL